MDSKLIFFPLLFLLCVNYVVTDDKVIVCYYGSWTSVSVAQLDPFICTHVIYAFASLESNGSVVPFDYALDVGKDNYKKFTALKEVNPKLKTLLAVGGWNDGSAKYSVMVNNTTLRQIFIHSTMKMMSDFDFDGFDIDWEYPARRDTVYGHADIDSFSTLLKELKEAFDPYGFILTAAVSAVESAASLSYDIPVICKYLDYINVMTYDMHGTWDGVTGHNSPLHAGEGYEGADPKTLFTDDVAIEYWLSQGAPASKLVLGMPFYGKTFNLSDPTVHGIKAPITGAGLYSGAINYSTMCQLLQNTTLDWEVHNDTLAMVPYAIQGSNWISFDNVWSITKKVDFAVAQDLAGVMIWSIEKDDINGKCGETWPLLKAINKVLGRDYESLSTTTTTTTEPATSA